MPQQKPSLFRRRCRECLRPFVITTAEVAEAKKFGKNVAVNCKPCRKLEVIDRRAKKVIKLLVEIKTIISKPVKEIKHAAVKKPHSRKRPAKLGK